jgi:hypothetical protein
MRNGLLFPCLFLLATLPAAGRAEPPGAARKHWAFRPVQDAPPPAVRDAAWARNPIDRFIGAALERKGLRPGPPADRLTLLRRVTFDLVGLPPTAEEVESFLRDDSPDAYEKVVDRLLASPHYGERWGRHWMDVIRYADTAGETADYPVPEAYRYRNYVLDAFNRDVPYDQFLREQLAGDILARDAAARGRVSPERYAELVTATGFLAVSRRFGYDTERYEYLTIADTLDVLGQAVQGLSLGCARCHDHKYDPVSTADYYALYGIFAGTRYAFAGSERLQAVRALVPLVPPAAARRREGDFNRRLDELERLRRQYRGPAAAGVPALPQVTRRWLTDLDGDFEAQAPPEGGSLGRPANPWVAVGEPAIDRAAQSPFTNVYPRGTNGASFPRGAADHALRRGLVPALTAARQDRLFFNLDLRTAGDPKGAGGSYRIYLGHGPGRVAAVELFVGPDAVSVRNGPAVERVRALKAGAWCNVQLTLDLRARTFGGTAGGPGDVVAFSGKALAPGWDGFIDTFLIDTQGHRAGPRAGLQADNFALSPEPLRPLGERGASAPRSTQPQGADALRSPAPDAVLKRIALLRRQLAEELEQGPFPQAYAVWEGTPQDVPIQKRGEPDRPGKVVPRRFLEVLGGQRLPPGAEGSGRRELADWLTSVENPLTARVMVNRIWQHHFGTGLVATPNDFGTRGRPPSHPALLDWLARRFVAGGWSVKKLHRLIVLSATYRLGSAEHPQAAAVDPDNRLLARFPRRRLEAECIRDALLVLGGTLERGPAGPHPFPPAGRLRYTQHNPFYGVYATNRRSVYLMTQRLRRHPFLALFDGPDTSASTAERTSTTVPTQALFLMNDPFVHRQSEGFAWKLLALGTDDAGRVERAFLLAFARRPTGEERADSLAFLGRYRAGLAGVGVPEGQREGQAWAALARTLFGRNEFVFVD